MPSSSTRSFNAFGDVTRASSRPPASKPHVTSRLGTRQERLLSQGAQLRTVPKIRKKFATSWRKAIDRTLSAKVGCRLRWILRRNVQVLVAAAVHPQANLARALQKASTGLQQGPRHRTGTLGWAPHEVAGTVPRSRKMQRFRRSLVLRAQQMGPAEAVLHLRRRNTLAGTI